MMMMMMDICYGKNYNIDDDDDDGYLLRKE